MNEITLSSIFGPLLIILGLWSMMHLTKMKKICESFQANPCCLYLAGLINLLLGLTIIQFTYWALNLTFFITLLGWFMLVKGILILFFSGAWSSWMKKCGRPVKVFCAVITIIWGLALCSLAFQ
ncbi:MAG: hypothetical protein KAR79_02985 [Simkaniaceae bacterium]|nr:hypothetical protein [Simkaniaceae bacterium]